MTATTTVADVADPATATPFARALAQIEYLLDVDPDRAREEFAAALRLASPAEREFLDHAATILSQHPYPIAARKLGWIAKNRPELRGMVTYLTADTNPDLYRPAMPDPTEVTLEAAEWVRRSIRDYRNRDRYTATFRAETDNARTTPDAVLRRRTRQPSPYLRHRERDQRTREQRQRDDAEFASYAARRLFVIETDPDLSAPLPHPRKRTDLMWAHVQAGLWDRSYFLHVAQNYLERDRDVLSPASPSDRPNPDTARIGRDAALDDAARSFLGEHDTDTGQHRQASRRRWVAQPKKLTTADQTHFALTRTGLPEPSDYDEYLPYTQLDEPDDTRGMDYDRSALTSYRGWPCVGCWIDRPDSDLRAIHVREGRRVSDDGLCDICRADGHPGIPALPTPWGHHEFVLSRCAYIAATHPAQARQILDRIRAAAANTGPTWRIITRWMAMNLDEPTVERHAPRRASQRRRRPTTLGAGQRIGRCDSCARTGVVHSDNFCTQCRIDLGMVIRRVRTDAA